MSPNVSSRQNAGFFSDENNFTFSQYSLFVISLVSISCISGRLVQRGNIFNLKYQSPSSNHFHPFIGRHGDTQQVNISWDDEIKKTDIVEDTHKISYWRKRSVMGPLLVLIISLFFIFPQTLKLENDLWIWNKCLSLGYQTAYQTGYQTGYDDKSFGTQKCSKVTVILVTTLC